METMLKKSELVASLQSDICSLQGFRIPALGEQFDDFGLGPVLSAFPGQTFPRAGVHEFISNSLEQKAVTTGFVAALAGKMIQADGPCVWVGLKRNVYPFALSQFGIEPHHVIFVDIKNNKDLLWAIEEALRCDVLSAVIGEVGDLNLTESRRLQLAVEKSKVTGLLHRICPRVNGAVASVCRWRINSLPGQTPLPGVGFPSWEVTIDKVRNGTPGKWQITWENNRFEHIRVSEQIEEVYQMSNVG